MLPKTNVFASAAAATLALLPATLGAVEPQSDPTPMLNCQSLGTGALGIFEGNPPIYHPNFYMLTWLSWTTELSVLKWALTAKLRNPNSCSARRRCLSLSEKDLSSTTKVTSLAPTATVLLSKVACSKQRRAGTPTEFTKVRVVPEQHLQFQKMTFNSFINVEYLWDLQGPVSADIAGATQANNLSTLDHDGYLHIDARNASIRTIQSGSQYLVGQVNPIS